MQIKRTTDVVSWGERTCLRELREKDVQHIMTWVNSHNVVGNIAAFSGEDFTEEQELAYVKKMRDSKTDVVHSIWTTVGRMAYLGQVGLHQIDWRAKVARLAVVIGDSREFGKGYGSDAIRQALTLAFGRLELHKVWLLVFRTNARSIRTYKRIGFIEEGVLRQEYLHNGGYHDMVRMSVLAQEWYLSNPAPVLNA